MLFYEPKENERMGVKRVQMAAEAGANVIVTACPFCMVNIEDAIKVSGMEGKMTAIDLAELVDQQLVRGRSKAYDDCELTAAPGEREIDRIASSGRAKVEILVCARRVPDTSENEIQLNGAGNDIERDDLVYSINEADNYAVEEALQIIAKRRRQGDGRHRWRRRGRRDPAPRDGHGRQSWRAALRRSLRRIGRQRHRDRPEGLRATRTSSTSSSPACRPKMAARKSAECWPRCSTIRSPRW